MGAAEPASFDTVGETIRTNQYQSRFSEFTNDRDYRAVVQPLFEVLHTPQSFHQREVQRKRLKWMTRGVIAVDNISLELTRSVSVVVSDEFVGDEDDVSKIDTDDGGLELHCTCGWRK